MRRHSSSPQRRQPHSARTTNLIATLILFIGALACGLILALGATAANSEQKQQFKICATEAVHQLELVWNRYESATLCIHQTTRSMDNPRKEFSVLNEYLRTNLDFLAIGYSRNASLAERPLLEAKTRQVYKGFFEMNTMLSTVQPAAQRPFYFPLHHVAPIEDHGLYLYCVWASRPVTPPLFQFESPWNLGETCPF